MNTSRIDIQGLCFNHGARAILKDLELHLETGSITAVLGPNGAGKSTLLSCMAGLLSAPAGHIHLDGRPLTGIAPTERAQRIAFLPQTPEIAWAVDVATLVALGRIPFRSQCSDAENERAIEHAMQLTDVAQWRDRSVQSLSGGERARVLLARVLAGESAWVLADEPFTGLDPAHQFEAAELLRSVASRGGGVVLTIHDLTLAARIADRIVILDGGHIVADGAPRDALTQQTLRDVYRIETQWLDDPASGTPTIVIHGRSQS